MTRARPAALDPSFVCDVQGTRGFVMAPTGRLKFGWKASNGYLYTSTTSDDGGTMSAAVHNLVLGAYEPGHGAADEQGWTADHFDQDRSNNTQDNLRYRNSSYQNHNRTVPGFTSRKVRASPPCALITQAEAG